MILQESLQWRPQVWCGMGTVEGPETKFLVDFSLPTNHEIKNRRPNLVAMFQERRLIVIFKVACAWEALIV